MLQRIIDTQLHAIHAAEYADLAKREKAIEQARDDLASDNVWYGRSKGTTGELISGSFLDAEQLDAAILLVAQGNDAQASALFLAAVKEAIENAVIHLAEDSLE